MPSPIIPSLTPSCVCWRARFRRSCRQENPVSFSRLLRELRLDCTVKNGPGGFIGLLFLHLQTNFLRENCSVFGSLSLSTPAKQHAPRSERILIRFFPGVAFSQLRCFCSDMAAALGSLLALHTSRRCRFGGVLLPFFSFEDLHHSTSVVLLFSTAPPS